jgi:hypothetical protein
MRRAFLYLAVAVLCLPTNFARAYNPPVDASGPITARIEGPQLVTQTETPLPVRVIVENKGDKPLEGAMQVAVIDRWRVEPAGEVRFRVEAKGTATREFKVIAGAGTYSAHYPIHAYVWDVAAKAEKLHPILILETRLPKPPRPPLPVEWKPVAVPGAGELALWRLPVRRAVVHVLGEQPQTMPVGWEGSEPRSRATLQFQDVTLGGKRRAVVGVHPPWFEKHVGTMLVEYALELPKTAPLKLKFAHAVTPEGQGDGVTFRVRAVAIDAPAGDFGKILFERHSAAKTWQEAEADLGALAGQAVRLQLESHPGPKNDTGWDQSYWAEPTLVAGTLAEPPPFPPKDDAGSQVLGNVGAKPQAAGYQVRMWPGRRGLLDTVIGFVQGDKRLCFRGFEVRVLGGRIDDARSPILLVEAKEEPCANGRLVRHRFQSHLGTFELVGRLCVEQGVLRAKFHLENTPPPRPWAVVSLEDVAVGPWSHTAKQVYAGHGNVIRDPQAYTLGFDGHRLATSFVGFDFDGAFSLVQAVDVPPDRFEVRPAERHYSLHVPHASTTTFVPSQNAFAAVKVWREVNGLKPAAGVQKLAGRFVFDLWGGRYRESGESLERAFRYGLTDAAVIWHNWQRWGYDYRLPEINPPNPQFGATEELRQMIRACRQAGVLFALHDNYIDFYPDADKFSYEKMIAFDRSGEPVKAWLNEGRGARSYRFRADVVAPFLQANLQWIREQLAPDAYFIDVWSSINPYDYWTADGRFFDRVSTRTGWGAHFAWIRRLLGNDAPQISESGHDQLIGWLDGATANHLRVSPPMPGRYSWSVWDWKCGDAERIPWLDAAHHDRFILHGAGYGGRYEGGLDPRLHGIYSDDYITTEVLTGHPGMVPQAFGRDVVRKYWLLHDLMRALALARIEQVEFVDGDLHRQHVTWGNSEVWVNRGSTDWKVADHVLPQYGFLARVPGKNNVEAGITRRDGLVVEWARAPQLVYVNGRQAGKPIDFGGVTTAGACRLSLEGKNLLVTPLPDTRGPKFSVRLLPAALPWKLPEATHIETLDESGKVLARQPVRREGDAVLLDCEPGVFAYRLVRG